MAFPGSFLFGAAKGRCDADEGFPNLVRPARGRKSNRGNNRGWRNIIMGLMDHPSSQDQGFDRIRPAAYRVETGTRQTMGTRGFARLVLTEVRASRTNRRADARGYSAPAAE